MEDGNSDSQSKAVQNSQDVIFNTSLMSVTYLVCWIAGEKQKPTWFNEKKIKKRKKNAVKKNRCSNQAHLRSG